MLTKRQETFVHSSGTTLLCAVGRSGALAGLLLSPLKNETGIS